MTRVETAVSRFKEGCNCSQAIFSVYTEPFGLSRECALRVACGFGGGMRLARTCGAVTGAVMVLGWVFGPEACPGQPAKDETYRRVEAFAGRFADGRGSLECRELLGCDIATPEGLAQARAEKLFTTICPDMVRTAAEILEDMLKAQLAAGEAHR
jgi:C_GCAxxG_C_C family probable redox protein